MIDKILAKEITGGANKVLDIMVLLQGIPDPINRNLFPAHPGITSEDLKDAQAPQSIKLSFGEKKGNNFFRKKRSGW